MLGLLIIGITIFLFGLFMLAAMCAAGAREDEEIQRLMKERNNKKKEGK